LTNKPLCVIIKIQKRKGMILMANTTINYYMSMTTGEVVFTQREAMELYREGHIISVWSWSEVCQEMIERVRWEH
jgi:hypothetical protein